MYHVSEACSSPTVANGLLSDKATQIYKAKESVSITCIAGYIPNNNVATCLPTKVLSPPPVCNKVNCTVPILNNGQYLTEAWVSANELSIYIYGTTWNIQCNTLYEITIKPNNPTCQEDGTWDPSPPHCLKITCKNSTDVSHASIDNYT